MDIRKISPSVLTTNYIKNTSAQPGTISNPAISGQQLFSAGLPSGDYWIKPTSYAGSAKLLYVDNTNRGGGWVLVAKGRESSDANAWWADASYNENQLINSSRATTTVARVDSSFVGALWGSGSWTSNSNFLVNRAEVGDSWRYLLPSGRTFSWTDFGGAQNVSTSPVNATSGSRWSAAWWTGSEIIATNFNYWDWYATGNNDGTRIFSWWWSGHGNFRGWSAGASVTNGFQAGSEGHAIQTVQIYIK
jgi:hypothetical protein